MTAEIAIINSQGFEKIRNVQKEFEQLCAKFARPYTDTDPAEVEADINEAIAATREKSS